MVQRYEDSPETTVSRPLQWNWGIRRLDEVAGQRGAPRYAIALETPDDTRIAAFKSSVASLVNLRVWVTCPSVSAPILVPGASHGRRRWILPSARRVRCDHALG